VNAGGRFKSPNMSESARTWKRPAVSTR
jgi:hypothetical protein